MTVTGVPAPPGDLQALKTAISMKRPLMWDWQWGSWTGTSASARIHQSFTWHCKTQQCCPLLSMQCVSLTQRFQSFASFPHGLMLLPAGKVTISWAFTSTVDPSLLIPIWDTSWIGNKLLLNGFCFLPLLMNSSCQSTAAAASSSFAWMQLCCFHLVSSAQALHCTYQCSWNVKFVCTNSRAHCRDRYRHRYSVCLCACLFSSWLFLRDHYACFVPGMGRGSSIFCCCFQCE